jgi:hypothetical protein
MSKKAKHIYFIYHETLGEAIQEIQDFMERNDVVSNEIESFFWGHVGYKETFRHSFEIDSWKGRGTRKCLQVQVYRFETGRYELNLYIG